MTLDGRDGRQMTEQLTLTEIFNAAAWASVVESYQHSSQFDQFETLFKRPQGIHGIRHARRVLFHTLVLCKLCSIDEQDQSLLVSAALFHDIGRDNDGLCYTHGKLSVEKMLALNLVAENRGLSDRLKFIISYHCIDDDQSWSALQKQTGFDREKTWKLFSVFKDADGLDRVRIKDLDTRYLRNPEALGMEQLAREVLAKF